LSSPKFIGQTIACFTRSFIENNIFEAEYGQYCQVAFVLMMFEVDEFIDFGVRR
jgi:hypothetical protein